LNFPAPICYSFGVEDADQKKAVLEALLFLSGEPVTLQELKAAADLSETEVRDLMDDLVSEYAERRGGILIGRVAQGYQMHTNPAQSELLARIRGGVKSQKLSAAALESLSIVAYRQPITKAEIEEIRGVNSDGVVKSLLEKHLVKIVGKKEAPGKPILYGTTREFLQYFGLNDLSELPTLKDMEREEAA
jgi:segregation and condensation protein B